MSDRLLLQLADPADYGVVGLRPAAVPRRLPHGRGWTLDGLVSTQVAVLGPDPAGAAQSALLRRIAAASRRDCAAIPANRLPRRVDAMPTLVPAAELAPRPPAAGGPARLPAPGSASRPPAAAVDSREWQRSPAGWQRRSGATTRSAPRRPHPAPAPLPGCPPSRRGSTRGRVAVGGGPPPAAALPRRSRPGRPTAAAGGPTSPQRAGPAAWRGRRSRPRHAAG